jgi:hypothetical protein
MALRSERRFIANGNIESGMLLEFSYTKIKDGSIKSYMVLVIDPIKKNETTGNEQLHALLVDDLNDMELIQLITKLGSFEFDPDNRAAPITNLQSDAAYTKYLGTVKSERRYRTFITKNISSLRQILIGGLEDAEDILPTHPAASGRFVELVPIEVIKQYMEYPNRNIPSELIESIRKNGIMEPLTITYYKMHKTALLTEGNHRVIAAERAGYKSVPVRVIRYERAWTDSMGNRPKVVSGFTPNEYGYVPGDLKPSQIGII